MKTSCYIGVTIVNHWCPVTMQACCRARGNVMIVASLQLTVSCHGWEHLQLQLLYIYYSQKTSNNATVSVPVSPTLIMNSAVKRNSKNSWLPRDWWRAAT